MIVLNCTMIAGLILATVIPWCLKNTKKNKAINGKNLFKRRKGEGKRIGAAIIFYPFAQLVISRFPSESMAGQRTDLKKLYPTGNAEYLCRQTATYRVSKILFWLLLVNMVSAIAITYGRTVNILQEGMVIRRNTYGEGDRSVELIARLGEEEKAMDITVSERRYTDDQLEKMKAYCETYITSNVIGQNQSLDNVTCPLNFFSEIEGYPVAVQWRCGDYALIGMKGEVKNDSLKQPSKTQVTAVMTYKDITWEYPLNITVYPAPRHTPTPEQLLEEKIRQQDAAGIQGEYLELPKRLDEQPVIWKESLPHYGRYITLGGLLLIILLSVRARDQVKAQLKLRDRQLEFDYPVLVHKFVLLLGAGMTTRAAWLKIVGDYEKYEKKYGKEHYVYEEMIVCLHQMQYGTAEVKAYEDFGRRCGLGQYLKFSSLLIQNIKIGAKGSGRILTEAADEAMLLRKENARKLGEQLGVKLLAPMMLLLVLVMLLVIVPAFMAMNYA